MTLRRGLLLLVLLVGCTGPILRPLAWEPWARYAPPEVAALVGTDPVGLLQGSPAPWDGVLLRAEDLTALVDERDRLVAALDTLHAGRGQDRAYADAALDSCRSAVEVCRSNQPRTFAAGVGAGAGACAVTAAGIAGATR